MKFAYVRVAMLNMIHGMLHALCNTVCFVATFANYGMTSWIALGKGLRNMISLYDVGQIKKECQYSVHKLRPERDIDHVTCWR